MFVISPDFIEALRIIQPRFDVNDVRWVLVGSLSLFLQGVAIEPHDIDILTTAEDTYKCQELLKEYLVQPVLASRTSEFDSHLGRFRVGNISVEVMGNLKVKEGKKWVSLVGRLQTPRRVTIADIKVPVSSLEDQLVGYAHSSRDKDKKVAFLIRKVLYGSPK